MNIVTLLSAISLTIYLILGIYVLTINIRSKTNFLFFLIASSLALWSLTQVFASMTGDRGIFNFWVKGSAFFAIIYFAFNLHFFTELTLTGRCKKIIITADYIPAFFLIIKYIFSKELLYIDVSRTDNLWIYTYLNSFWTYLLLGCGTIYILISLLFLYLWKIRSKLKKVKMQSIIISVCMFLGLIFVLLEAIILPSLTSYKSLGNTNIVIMIWIFGIFYSITKYHFLTLTPEVISNYVISNINESIILLDDNLRIIFANKKTEDLVKEKKDNLINKEISEIIINYDLIKNEVDKLLKNQNNSFSCRIYFKNTDEPILMDAKFSIVFDKINDPIGILVIANEVKELKQLKLIYKLSDREVEIVQLVIEGLSNKEIGIEANLTLSTVKSHLVHIFNKLNVNSRMEMLNLLNEFNLIPHNSIKRKILLLK